MILATCSLPGSWGNSAQWLPHLQTDHRCQGEVSDKMGKSSEVKQDFFHGLPSLQVAMILSDWLLGAPRSQIRNQMSCANEARNLSSNSVNQVLLLYTINHYHIEHQIFAHVYKCSFRSFVQSTKRTPLQTDMSCFLHLTQTNTSSKMYIWWIEAPYTWHV